MSHREPPSESPDKAEENGDAKPSMNRFKGLTKGLLGVSREDLAEAQRRYEGERSNKARR